MGSKSFINDCIPTITGHVAREMHPPATISGIRALVRVWGPGSTGSVKEGPPLTDKLTAIRKHAQHTVTVATMQLTVVCKITTV
jgi:hypothetical protein